MNDNKKVVFHASGEFAAKLQKQIEHQKQRHNIVHLIKTLYMNPSKYPKHDLKNNLSFIFDEKQQKIYFEFSGIKGTDFEGGQYIMYLPLNLNTNKLKHKLSEAKINTLTIRMLTESGKFVTGFDIPLPNDFSDTGITIDYLSAITTYVKSFVNDDLDDPWILTNSSDVYKDYAKMSKELNEKNAECNWLLKDFETIRRLKEEKNCDFEKFKQICMKL